jgi:glycosyltransferase involved in cell wall biosynthesis
MRIAIVGGVFGRSGAYRSAVRWTPETILVQRLSDRGHEVEALPHAATYGLSGFDIVHVHHLSWGAVAAASDRSRTPFVFTLHATTPAHPRTISFVLPRADAVVALWPQQARMLGERFRRIGGEVAVIPNGIDPGTFPFEQPEHPGDGRWQLVYVGQLIPGKGVDLLLRAVAGLRARHDVRLSLSYHVGTLEDELRALCRQLEIGDIVRFLGRTPQEQLAAIYQASHMVILPSTEKADFEALPSVLSEAMFTGALPVSTDVGGIRDQIGDFGIVVQPGDVAALASGIEHAMEIYPSHLERAREMSESARRRFSIEGMVSSHERLYERVVADARTRPKRHSPSLRTGTLLAGPALRVAAGLRSSVTSRVRSLS